MGNFIDLTGQEFGRLKVISEAGRDNQGQALWLCRCKCTSNVVVQGYSLRSMHTQSCGCLQREQTSKSNRKHGCRGTRLYEVWKHMKQRCCDSNDKRYADWGGRGISVCDEWLHDFQAFHDWSMANGYADDLTIDRRENDGNYEPSNCRWTTAIQQAQNTRIKHNNTSGCTGVNWYEPLQKW